MSIVARIAARRFARRFANAADDVTDRRVTRRVSALHTLRMLGQAAPGHRQSIVDTICAFLRMPGTDAPTRAVALQVLGRVLRPGGADFWPGMSIDLSGAVLAELDFSRCRIDGNFTLDGCALQGQTRFTGIVVGGQVSARGARFAEHAWLERSLFHGPVRFDGATFMGDLWSGATVFADWVSFAGADFTGHVWFGEANFGAPVDFAHAVFRRSVGLRGAVMQTAVSLDDTVFHGPARVSRQGDGWNITAPGWAVDVDVDNAAVGCLVRVGDRSAIERSVA